MAPDDVRTRLILLGGKVAGVDCPDCDFRGRDAGLAPHAITDITCPNCGTTILTEEEMSALRRAGKL